MKRSYFVFLLLVLTVSFTPYAKGAKLVSHEYLQAVDTDGLPLYGDVATEQEFTVEGIILNRPEFMVDTTPDDTVDESFNLSGQWQIYVQGEFDPNDSNEPDLAATAVWMGQMYSNLPFGTGYYTNLQWQQRLEELNYDATTGYKFAPGDRVRVTGKTKDYNGKVNINEKHNISNDVTIELIDAGVGLPQPELITLDDIKDENDDYIFDHTRQTGGERYQARLVRLKDVSFSDISDWGPGSFVEVTDGNKTLLVKLGLGWGFTKYSPDDLDDNFDIVGIFDQDGGDVKGDYFIWVMNYDGNQRVLTARPGAEHNLLGDSNGDGKVDFKDLADMANYWVDCIAGLKTCN
jgi:hypothetical protein